MNKPDLVDQAIQVFTKRLLADETEISRYAKRAAMQEVFQFFQANRVQGEPIGEVGTMPGTSGFTMACFRADEVPVGTKIYTTPQPAQAMPVCGAQNAESDPQAPLSLTAAPQQAEVTDAQILSLDCVSIDSDAHGTSFWVDRRTVVNFARAILALRPAQVAAPMSEIDIEDDDSLRFVQRVLESDAPKEDRQSARDMVVGLRKRVRKAHHGISAKAKKEGA